MGGIGNGGVREGAGRKTIGGYLIFILVYAAWLYGLFLCSGRMELILAFIALLATVGTFLLIAAIKAFVWRYQNGVDLFATLETDPEKVKARMLFIMQYHGLEETLKELNDIFRNYPQWELSNWEVFRAWYKAQIDHMLEYPEIYAMTMPDGTVYTKEDDPLYDPDAPDWEQYDRPRSSDDDDDDDCDDDDYDDYGRRSRRSADTYSATAYFNGSGFGIGPS